MCVLNHVEDYCITLTVTAMIVLAINQLSESVNPGFPIDLNSALRAKGTELVH